MPKPTIKIEGADQLIKSMAKFGTDGRKILVEVMLESSELVRQAAEFKAPRDTGNLSRHVIDRVAYDDEHGVIILIGPQYPDAAYGHIVEFGRSAGGPSGVQRAQPFLRPALDENIEAVQNETAREFKKRMGI